MGLRESTARGRSRQSSTHWGGMPVADKGRARTLLATVRGSPDAQMDRQAPLVYGTPEAGLRWKL